MVHKGTNSFLQVGRLDLRGLALSFQSTSVSSVFVVLFLLTSFSLPFSELACWDWPLFWLTDHLLQCYDTAGWIMWPVKLFPKWPVWCVEWDVKPYCTIQSCFCFVAVITTIKVKVQEGRAPKECRRGAHLRFIGCWARRWINHYYLWRMASATPDLWLPSQLKRVLIEHKHAGMARLSLPGWLVTYRDTLPTQRWSPI